MWPRGTRSRNAVPAGSVTSTNLGATARPSTGPTSRPSPPSPAITRIRAPPSVSVSVRRLALQVAVLRPAHLLARRQVQPELQPADALGADLRHLLVQDAAARRHPLDVAGPDRPLVAQRVAVPHLALADDRDRLDARDADGRETRPRSRRASTDSKWSSRRNGSRWSSRRVPMLRRRCTPAPSMTGSGVTTCATGRDVSLMAAPPQAAWAAVGPSPASVVRRMSRGSCAGKGRARCMVWRLSHITRSPTRHVWA